MLTWRETTTERGVGLVSGRRQGPEMQKCHLTRTTNYHRPLTCHVIAPMKREDTDSVKPWGLPSSNILISTSLARIVDNNNNPLSCLHHTNFVDFSALHSSSSHPFRISIPVVMCRCPVPPSSGAPAPPLIGWGRYSSPVVGGGSPGITC